MLFSRLAKESLFAAVMPVKRFGVSGEDDTFAGPSNNCASPVLPGEPVTHAPLVGADRHKETRWSLADCDRPCSTGTTTNRCDCSPTAIWSWLSALKAVGETLSWRLTCPQNRCSGTQLFVDFYPPAHPEDACPVGDAVRAEGASLLGRDDPRSSPALESFSGPWPDPLTARSTDQFTHHSVTQHGMPLPGLSPAMRSR